MPSPDTNMECPSTPVDVVDAPEIEEQESADESLMAVERSGDESEDSGEVIPTDLLPDAVRRYPVPAQRSKEAAPVEPRVPVPVPRQSQRQTASKHGNPYNLPKSACNAVSFTPDILSQVLAGMEMYTSEKLKSIVDG
ncbi:hypothetical protein ROHU_001558 [Labeo rohita]|uniref:Uncharacterized protein n=1 Tax=Labeo rohita TaxID=84645 RepID=A0A498MQS6_LABRO|nr:hypothetical protein ROHU_023690 [Labeo rohita]RXN37957.1 hypothetical protein ROHU_001558 [Labeo rohita]